MTGPTRRLCLAIAVAISLTMLGCQREGPPNPVGVQGEKPATGTNNPVEQAADTVTGTARTAIDRAKQTEGVIGNAAQTTAEQVKSAKD